VRGEFRLAHEISQAAAPSQAPWPMNQVSHRPRLNVAPGGRKLAGGPSPSDRRT
jgi:hypothetical protein